MLTRARHVVLLVIVFFLGISAAAEQEPPKPSSQPDYSKEAFVDEQELTKVVFDNDGTGTREGSNRIRIQSDAGVQRFGVLTYPYQSATESVEIVYIRVKKPDGSVIPTPTENIQDMPSEITRQAPFYSDLHEKHVAVKGLSVGDVLETDVRWHVTKPLAPVQFWFSYNFAHDFILLDEQLQISVPRARRIKWSSPNHQPSTKDEGERRIFTWTHSELQHKTDDETKQDQEKQVYQAARGKLPPADVELSTFQTWEEVGAWYSSLQSERVKPSAEIRAKAAELTKDAKDDEAKLHALYNYVSTQFRYIGVAFGIGRYQPHAAGEVLANQYGDCKDKHTLLAALLEAADIKAYPALINSSRDMDLDVPSPAQFDHVITAVPQGDGFVWLDTTAEVAPYGYLIGVLREKRSLVIPPDKPGTLVVTPVETASSASQSFRIDAKLSDGGALEGQVDRGATGNDDEIIFRAAFRKMPIPQWKDLVQQLSYRSGFSGDVSNVIVSSPEKLEEPFHLSYSYTRKDYPDWSEHRIGSPLPPLLSATADKKPSYPIVLGQPQEFRYESHLALPSGYTPELPANVDLTQDFAEYHVNYSVSKGVLTTSRRLTVKTFEVPLAEYETYKKFNKAVSADQNLRIAFRTSQSSVWQYQDEIWELPYSENAEAVKFYEEAGQAFDRKEHPEVEVAALQRAVGADPKFTRAWLWMGEIYRWMGKKEEALNAYRKGIEADPMALVGYKALGLTLMSMRKYEEAVSVWQRLLSQSPQNYVGLSNLAASLADLKRYDEAATTMEKVIDLMPDSNAVESELGTYYLRAGKEDKALEVYKKVIASDPKPLWFNNIAYALAEEKKQLPLALEYAERAVREEEEITAKVDLSSLKKEDLGYTPSLSSYWDTLAWVHFQRANYGKAEVLLNAGWSVTQNPVIADHLGQVYEKEGKTKAAIHMYQLALAVSSKGLAESTNMPETRARLEHLSAGATNSTAILAATPELSTIRTFKVPRITKDTVSAEFFVLMGRQSIKAKFVSGSEELKSAENVVNAIDFRVPFPDDGPSQLLRRGILSCYSVTGCSFVLYSPYDVHSVN